MYFPSLFSGALMFPWCHFLLMGVDKDEKYIGHENFPISMNLAELKNV